MWVSPTCFCATRSSVLLGNCYVVGIKSIEKWGLHSTLSFKWKKWYKSEPHVLNLSAFLLKLVEKWDHLPRIQEENHFRLSVWEAAPDSSWSCSPAPSCPLHLLPELSAALPHLHHQSDKRYFPTAPLPLHEILVSSTSWKTLKTHELRENLNARGCARIWVSISHHFPKLGFHFCFFLPAGAAEQFPDL